MLLVFLGAITGCGQKDSQPTISNDQGRSPVVGPTDCSGLQKGPEPEPPPESLANMKADIVLTAAECIKSAS